MPITIQGSVLGIVPLSKPSIRLGRPPYPWQLEGILGIDRVVPYYEKGELEGVFAATFTLDAIGEFLESLKIDKLGQAFIIERSGRVIGTSTREPLAISKGEKKSRNFSLWIGK
ncbi:MAG: cache domain-containing protein [Cyanobacteria bacterium P01_E01_bin.42]